MNTDTSFIPIYIKLYERRGRQLEQLVHDVENFSKEFSIENDVTLTKLSPSDNSSLYMLVYCINTKPSRQRHSNNVGQFLDKIFSQLADKHPAYVEPLNLEPESSK